MEFNKYQTPLTDELLESLPQEVRDQLLDIINNVVPCRSPSHGSAYAVLLVECPSSPPSLWKNSVLFKKKFSMGITSSRTPQLLPSVNSQRVMTKSVNFFGFAMEHVGS